MSKATRKAAAKDVTMTVNSPTPGRCVYYKTAADSPTTLVGIIAFVSGPEWVNLAVFDNDGNSMSRKDVKFVQDAENPNHDRDYCYLALMPAPDVELDNELPPEPEAEE